MLPNGWQPADSTAIEAFRFRPADGVLQVLYAEGRMVYDYPCTELMYERFLRAPSKGRFVNEVLKPHAERLGRTPRGRPWGTNLE